MDKEYFTQPMIELNTHESGDPTVNMKCEILQDIIEPNVHIDLKLNTSSVMKDLITTPVISLCKYFQEPDKIPLLKTIVNGMEMYGNFPNDCHLKKGSFYLNDFRINSEQIPSGSPDGKYLVDFELLLGTKVIFKVIWHAVISHV